MMTIGLVGKKRGMTRVFTTQGDSIPVTVIEVEPNRISQIKTCESDGYNALQVTTIKVKSNKVNKAQAGHFSKAEVEAGRVTKEFRVDNIDEHQVGNELNVSLFAEEQFVDVTGTSIGKGFAGVIKRYNFAMQDATHGNSLAHRAPGSIGQNQTPGRVFKGKKMAGHMGNRQCTTQNLQIIRVDSDRNLLLIKGAVPGAIGNTVIVKPAVKINSEAK